MSTWLNVNKNRIAGNIKKAPEDREPVLRAQKGKSGSPVYGDQIEVKDPATGEVIARVLYSPDKPILKCGARVAIEISDGYLVEVT